MGPEGRGVGQRGGRGLERRRLHRAANDIVDLFGIAKAARVAVSGDTGPLHIAAAVGTPVVALFGPTWAERNGPWNAADVVVARTNRCECLYQRRCHLPSPCIDDIPFDEAMQAVIQRVGRIADAAV